MDNIWVSADVLFNLLYQNPTSARYADLDLQGKKFEVWTHVFITIVIASRLLRPYANIMSLVLSVHGDLQRSGAMEKLLLIAPITRCHIIS